ncbi:MAG: DNA topoisomerase I [Bacteroidetes bacterium GWF2_41_31]|nr:MAG: DNA topoisomerase I [Bacteroidetes bacterium GWF2_41_31]OFZ02350.1 MAG: DNA topoisomerase I [Bacteroidetes bacterium RIFOXYB12_FULL_41_6]
MAKNLVIVESPAKAKTIEGFLGKDFVVKSSFGHVMDLNKTKLSVDVEQNFEPKFEVSADKKKLVAELKKLAKEAEMVWLASDEDREGEAISWHLFTALGLKENKTKRIVFHEITKTAILTAIENPRNIDRNLVSAQQARRVLDRLVGYELSPLLWKKVKPSLSAGRVQSVAVRLIVEREEEIKNFNSSPSYRTVAEFVLSDQKEKQAFQAEYPIRFEKHDQALEFLQQQMNASFVVKQVETKPAKKSPAAPFTTSTLQQEAARKLGFSVANTMRVAQNLYESGKITYMRTDSVNLSGFAINMAKDEITSAYGKEYVKTRKYTTKTKGAQEAHEAIRPTYMNQSSVSGNADEKRLYELIWKRTIASQMSDAELERTQVKIASSKANDLFVASGEVIKFDGFLKVYLESSDDEPTDQEGILPAMRANDSLDLIQMTSRERYSKHPPRYSEASLVKKMEELGIGRPSTYAPTISTIQKREYVVKETRTSEKRSIQLLVLKGNKISEKTLSENVSSEQTKLFPTDVGSLVNKFLMQYFDDIIDFNFTANVEKEFDEIADGLKEWNQMIKEFYGPFHSKIEQTEENSGKFSGEKCLGVDPESGKKIYVKIGRFGPLAQIGDTDSEEKPRFAGLRKTQSIETITLEEALKLFDFPRTLGEYEENEVSVAIGRFGPYVKFDSKFYSLKKDDNPADISLDRAIEIILEKQQAEREKLIKKFDQDEDVQLLNGRYGPYLVIKKQNFKLPKGIDPNSLTLEECYKISEDPKNMPKKRFVKKKK